jgi:prophage antirepressor-like protein
VAKDIAEALGYSDTNAMTRGLDDDEMSKIAPVQITGASSMAREFTIINESGLYSAILRSKREEAKAFKKWVTSEVLPAIRKKGGYVAPSRVSKIREDAEIAEIASNLFESLKKVAKLVGCDENAASISANNGCKVVTGTDVLSIIGHTHLISEKQDKVFTVTDLGKTLSEPLSAVKLNKMIEAAGLQERIGNEWVPTDKGKPFCRVFDTGKKHSNGTMIQQVKWFESVLKQI